VCRSHCLALLLPLPCLALQESLAKVCREDAAFHCVKIRRNLPDTLCVAAAAARHTHVLSLYRYFATYYCLLCDVCCLLLLLLLLMLLLLLLRFVLLPACLLCTVCCCCASCRCLLLCLLPFLPLSLLLQRAICDFSSATIVATPVTTCVSQTCAFAVCVGGLACWLVLAGCGPGTL
jgi:hypothetical protein